MVSKWGTDIEAKLSSRSAVRYLMQCEGIGKARAEKIKAAWDATQGEGGDRGRGPCRGGPTAERAGNPGGGLPASQRSSPAPAS